MTSPRLKTILLLVSLSSALMCKICKESEALGVNNHFEEQCYSCGSNCSTCLLMHGNKPQCFYCKDGFYLQAGKKGDYSCLPCVEGCRTCIGPDTSQCEQMMDFYYYDSGLEKLKRCDESCSKCKDDTHCLKCSDGFYPELEEAEAKAGVGEADATTPDNIKNGDIDKDSNTENSTTSLKAEKKEKDTGKDDPKDDSSKSLGEIMKESKTEDEKEVDETNMSDEEKEKLRKSREKQFLSSMERLEKKLFDLGLKVGIVLGNRKFKCKNCDVENCEICNTQRDQLKKNTFVTCRICKKGFTLVDGKCRPCPLNCEFCKEQTSECVHCAEGFEFVTESNTCQAIPVKNCSVMEGDTCSICDNWFYLESSSNKCKPCKKEVENCSHCLEFQGQVRCQFCERGYFLKTEQISPAIIEELRRRKEKKDKNEVGGPNESVFDHKKSEEYSTSFLFIGILKLL